MMIHRLLCVGVIVCSCLLGATTARAASQDSGAAGGGVSNVDTFEGSATYSIPIQVPAFHGVEPAISLGYNSSGSNGWVGVGWSLSGFGIIERTSVKGGAPSYDAGDSFRLNGVPLVACGSGSTSPSCATGGTHSAKIENYLRIQSDPTNNKWYVWHKTGTRFTYSALWQPVAASFAGTFTWALTSVADTRGNTVNYSWACDSTQYCGYPAAITYNGVTVNIYRETRPDPYTLATGISTGAVNYRIKTMDVLVGGSRARTYKISYGTSASTRRSLVTSVQMFGKDAMLDASGTVTGGTSLPAQTFAYQDTAVGSYAIATTTLPTSYATNPDSFQLGDYDGDGKMDLIQVGANHCDNNFCYIYTWHSNGDGTFAQPVAWATNLNWGNQGIFGRFYVADFDGDGKADVIQMGAAGTWSGTAFHSNGNGTFSIVPGAPYTRWYCNSPGSCVNPYSTISTLPMDVNGDGLMDLVQLEYKGGGPPDATSPVNALTVAIAVPGGGTVTWNQTTIDLPASYATGGAGAGTFESGDFNGDGRADLVYISAGTVQTFLSTGTGFPAAPSHVQSGPISPINSQNDVVMGDFNGDGKTDIFYIPLGFAPPITTQMWLSNGNGTFTLPAGWSPGPFYCTRSSTGTIMKFLSGDFNGDGKTDFMHAIGDGEIYTWMGNGDGTFNVAFQGSLDNVNNMDAFTVGDANGDGKTDAVFMPLNRKLEAALSSGSAGNLLATIANGMGGSYSLSYAPSSTWPNGLSATNMTTTNTGTLQGQGAIAVPNPSILQTVSAMTMTDGRGWSATTRYQYSGALYDAIDRQFLGFRYVKTTLPKNPEESAAPYAEIYYKQGYGFIASPEWNYAYSGDGTLLKFTNHEWTTNGATIPYTFHETGIWSYDYSPDGSGQYKRTYTSRTYDTYGNTTSEISYGDYDIAGDEKRKIIGYSPNTAAFITGLPSYLQIWSGLSGGTKLKEVLNYYDGATAYSIPPTLGGVTQSLAWNSANNSYGTIGKQFDAYGNVVASIDAMGAVTTTTFDGTYHLFPVSVIDPLGHTTGGTSDPVCGVPVSVTDANQRTTTSAYDALCRLVRVDLPGGGWEIHSFDRFGDPNAQRIATYTPPADGVNYVNKADYLDGLGRTYQTRTDSNGTTATYVATTFNARGEVATQSKPFQPGETPQYESIQYDALDRPLKKTHPDGSFVSTQYVLWGAIGTDELGHKQEAHFNALGKVATRKEWLAGSAHVTSFTYDLDGQLVQAVDPAGNTTTLSYDSLGRLLTRTDPDLGTASFQYDAAGRGIASIDAKGQIIESAYDALGRKIAQGVDRPSQSIVIVSARGSGAAMNLHIDGASVASFTTSASSASYTWTGKVVGSVDVECANCGNGTTLTVNSISVDGISRAGADPSVIAQTAASVAASSGVLSAPGKLRTLFGDSVTWFDQPGYGDSVGRMTGTLDASGWTSVTYDVAGRVTNKQYVREGNTYTFQTSYDLGGRVVGVRYPDGDVLGRDPVSGTGAPFTYDIGGRPAAIPGVVTSLSYTSQGQPRVLTNANGTATTFSYSAQRGWGTRIQTSAGATSIQDLTLVRDAKCRLTQITSPFASEGWTYSYDDMDRLTAATVSGGATDTFAYDPLGNIISVNGTTYSYPAPGSAHPHAVTSVGGSSFSYDANGNMLAGAGRSYTWDAFNRPTTIGTTSFVYAASGSRTKKVASGTATLYFDDGYEITNGTVTKLFSIAGMTVAQKIGATMSWLHGDHLGSIQVRTDATGAVLERQTYRPYGQVLAGTLESPVGYTSERRDETGLVYLHARYYDPVLLRFVSADPTIPTGRLVGLNHYAYAGNNPVNLHDRTGLRPDPGAGSVAGNGEPGLGGNLLGRSIRPVKLVQLGSDGRLRDQQTDDAVKALIAKIEREFHNVTIDPGGSGWGALSSDGWNVDELSAIELALRTVVNGFILHESPKDAFHATAKGWAAFYLAFPEIKFVHTPWNITLSHDWAGYVRDAYPTTIVVTPWHREHNDYGDSMRNTIIHEMGHVLDDRLHLHGGLETATGGSCAEVLTGCLGGYHVGEKTTPYGETNPMEDFAESWKVWFIGGDISQSRYDYITGIVDGFLNQASAD